MFMKKLYKDDFIYFKNYIKMNKEKIKLDFDLFCSRVALSNIGALIGGLDEKSSKELFINNLKNYQISKKKKRALNSGK